jgi:hypothetical protein
MRRDLAEVFRRQALACERLGSPHCALVCRVLAENLDGSSTWGRRIDAWSGSPVIDALALRAAGALHGLVRSGRAPRLAAQYPPHGKAEPSRLWAAIAETLGAHDEFLCAYLDGPPQTNEVGRSSALLGAALLVAEQTGLGLSWHEIGASAGLNLAFDQYYYELGSASHGDCAASVRIRSSWEGNLPRLSTSLEVLERSGADLQPIDPASEIDRARLLSYVWPDQPERLERTIAALDVAAGASWRVQRASAVDAVRAHFGAPLEPDRAHVLVNTIVWQYLPRAECDAITRLMDDAARRATTRCPVAWFSMEADDVPDSAALHLGMWPAGERRLVGRADFHGRWVRWI